MEKFLVKRIEENSAYEAQSWLLLADVLQPHCFTFQFKQYTMCKEKHSINECAKLLEDMYVKDADGVSLHNCNELRRELYSLTQLCLCTASCAGPSFHCSLVDRLSDKLKMYALDYVFVCDDVNLIEHCYFALKFTQEFANLYSHLFRLVDFIVTSEAEQHFDSSYNCYRKLLVLDILPVVLKIPESTQFFNDGRLLFLFNKVLEFFMSAISSSPCIQFDTEENSKRKEESSTPVLAPAEHDTLHVHVFSLLRLISSRLDWKLGDILASDDLSDLSQVLRSIMDFCVQLKADNDEEEGLSVEDEVQQLVSCTAPLLILHIWRYIQAFYVPPTAAPDKCILLIRSLSMTSDDNSLRHGFLRESAAATSDGCCSVSTTTSTRLHRLMFGFRLWLLLVHGDCAVDVVSSEMSRTLCVYGVTSTCWYRRFVADAMCLVCATSASEANCGEAPLFLHTLCQPSARLERCAVTLRHAHSLYGARMYSRCVYTCLSAVCDVLPDSGGNTGATTQSSLRQAPPTQLSDSAPSSSSSASMLHVISHSAADVTVYCAKLILWSLYRHSLGLQSQMCVSDTLLGHMIVLAQLDWPAEHHIVTHALSLIARRNAFCYACFGTYVTCGDILEQFLAISSTEQPGGVHLMLHPSSQSNRHSVLTRGVDKVMKEDMNRLMLSLVRNSQPILSIISRFLISEKQSLLQCIQS